MAEKIKNIKAIFWDNDGILVNTEHLYFIATKTILDKIGIDLTEDQFTELFLIQGKGAWHLAEERGFTQREIEILRNERNRLYDHLLISGDILIEGVHQVIEQLHEKYMMGIVTSCRKDHFNRMHSSTGILKYFKFVIAHGDYKMSKPDPEPYQKAIQYSGLKNDECIVIEDSLRGLTAASAAGLKCIVIPGDLTRNCSFEGAYLTLKNISELLSVL